LLSIKPVVTIRDGEISILGKARGSKQGNNLLATEIQKCGGVDFSKPLMLGYTGLSDALLEKYVLDSGSLWDGHGDCMQSTAIGSVIGTHAGPGAIAVAFFSA
jgi:fatty acid-binding protein DegV